jgi:hypothetical protein
VWCKKSSSGATIPSKAGSMKVHFFAMRELVWQPI